jgi:DnaK suppressor protein
MFSETITVAMGGPMKKSVPETTSLETYRQMLLAKRENVLSRLGIRFDTMARLGRVAEDDQAQITHEEFISLRMNSLDYRQLRMIDEALLRLDSGDFGACLACEEPIPPNVRALPWPPYCVTCQDAVASDRD